jgi:hypothetical protein
VPGESLSSWRQRVGWSNGYRLFPLEDGRLRRSDPDAGVHPVEFEWIANTHSIDQELVRDMTLRSFIGRLVKEIHPRHHAPWWVRARYGETDRNFGGMYCPQCLAEDEVPHFRLSWRLGFNVVCPRHRLVYLDSCQRCGTAPWPAGGCTLAAEPSPCFTTLANCWRCGESLIAGRSAYHEPIQEPQAWLQHREVTHAGLHVTALDLFAALRAICQVFIRKRTRDAIAASGTEWASVVSALGASASGQAVEHLPVAERLSVISAAVRLLAGWPDSFVAFANECGVSRAHFCGARSLHPAWMEAVINNRIAKQNRWVTEAHVREMVQIMRCEACPITKAAIRKRLSWQGDIPDEWLN